MNEHAAMARRHLLSVAGLQMLAHLARGHLRVRISAEGQNLEEQHAVRPAARECFSYEIFPKLRSISIEETPMTFEALCIYTPPRFYCSIQVPNVLMMI